MDPPDHLSPLNPASHPELLDELSTGFIQHKYDLKWLHRTILTSRTYQQSSVASPANRTDTRNYSHFYLRRLPAEVLVDALNHATGGSETYPPELFLPAGARAMEVAGSTSAGGEGKAAASLQYAFHIFGRPQRSPDVQCDCERETSATVVQTLYLANHPRVQAKISSPQGRVARIAKEIADDDRRHRGGVPLGARPSSRGKGTADVREVREGKSFGPEGSRRRDVEPAEHARILAESLTANKEPTMNRGCSGYQQLNRRDFFRVGGTGLFGLSFADFFQARAAGPAKAKQMILIWLSGGPPHQDMFDMKPDTPPPYGSELKPGKTNVPGIEFCELMPRLAQMADKFSILRSVGIGNEKWEHSGGLYWLCGNPRTKNDTVKAPMYGSVVAKERPATPGLPSFVAFGPYKESGDLAVNYLGPAYDPMLFQPGNAKDEVGRMLVPAAGTVRPEAARGAVAIFGYAVTWTGRCRAAGRRPGPLPAERLRHAPLAEAARGH